MPPTGASSPGGLRWGERRTLGLRKWRGQRVHGAIGASPRHARAPTRASMPLPRRRLASPEGWGSPTGCAMARAASPLGASCCHSRAPTRESMPLPRRRLALDALPCWLRVHGDGPPARHPPLPPTPPNSLPTLLNPPIMPVEACPEPVEGGLPKHPALAPRPASPDLRVNVAKCRRMSHYFDPPLVNSAIYE